MEHAIAIDTLTLDATILNQFLICYITKGGLFTVFNLSSINLGTVQINVRITLRITLSSEGHCHAKREFNEMKEQIDRTESERNALRPLTASYC